MQNTRWGGKVEGFGKLHMWTRGAGRMCHFPIMEYFGSNNPKMCATFQDICFSIYFSQYMPNPDKLIIYSSVPAIFSVYICG